MSEHREVAVVFETYSEQVDHTKVVGDEAVVRHLAEIVGKSDDSFCIRTADGFYCRCADYDFLRERDNDHTGEAYASFVVEYSETEYVRPKRSDLSKYFTGEAEIERKMNAVRDAMEEMRAKAMATLDCICEPVENPYNHFGVVEPGGALIPDPDCSVHFPEQGNE